jgi:Flp pilus assembly protein TadB
VAQGRTRGAHAGGGGGDAARGAPGEDGQNGLMRKPVRRSASLTLLAVLAVLLYLAVAAVFHLPTGWVIALVVPLIAITLAGTYVRSRRDRRRARRNASR